MAYADETIDLCRKLYLRRYRVPEIVKQTGVPRRTVYCWINRYSWDDLLQTETPLEEASRRLAVLFGMESKTDAHFKEIENLITSIDRLNAIYTRTKQTVKKQSMEPANDSDVNNDQESRPARRRKAREKKKQNDFSGIDADVIKKKFFDGLFRYQTELWDARVHRIRNLLKSRQIGATYYFAREAFADALLEGRNKIFLSASRAQADTFRDYIQGFSQEWFDCELKGRDKIKIHSDAGVSTLYFLSTNSATAQSYHGDTYMDEYFWIPHFTRLNTVASAMATQKQYRKTYFSTPSAMSHTAYPFWSMDQFNERKRRLNQPLESMPGFKELQSGILCPDGQYRKIITIHDAEAGGCDLFDIEQLQLEYGPDEFAQLFECQFIDDSASEFTLAMLEPCAVDRAEWRDFKPDMERPFGNRPVWIGYDPSRTRDGATITVVAPPLENGGRFRVLEKITLQNAAWAYQAASIHDLTKKYNVQYIGIDVTGPGTGVFELVKNFYPAATPIVYSVETKTRLVLKAKDVISNGRLQYDASWSDIPAGFMSIRRTTTGSGQLTYVADRSERTGHADAAWSLMHALMNERLDFQNRRQSRYLIPE
ncbi:terminase ATPase subunit family protein [Kistimonas scapharcae]|uniref:Terminase ATPase subunit family protein n=1 Tax=Kistimonas scapharcae TaxID=1036133 RepID=A0ABP8UYM5_9GAMM